MLVTEIYIYFVSVESPTHVHLIESWIITSNNNNDDRPPKLKILWTSDRRTKKYDFERIWDLWTNIHTTRHLNCATQFIDGQFWLVEGKMCSLKTPTKSSSTILSKKSK